LADELILINVSGQDKPGLMSLLMAIGRLEMFAIIVLFTPRFWRSY